MLSLTILGRASHACMQVKSPQSWVELVNRNNGIKKYRLLGPDEINPSKNHISIDSPMGKAILGKKVGDEIKINSPSGMHHYQILGIEYRQPAEQ